MNGQLDAIGGGLDPGLEKIKQGMRAAWMAGDFGVIAKSISHWAEEFAMVLPIAAGDRVLDVATGTGNVAIPLARRGAVVTGVDIATNLLGQARERAAAERLAVRFDEGDAEQLPYADGAFDAVVSMYGAMFAPRPERVAAEAARVLRPGGLLAMANWNPESFSGRMLRVRGPQAGPPPPDLPSPLLWGDAAVVRERLAPFFTEIETRLIPIEFDLPYSPAGTVEHFRSYFGPTQVAFSRLDEQGKAAMAAELEALWSEANVAPDPGVRTLVKNEFLQVTARRM